MSTDAPIQVVAAVVERSGTYLLCQREEGPHLSLKWEFPGGKIESGETPEAALEREIAEELGVACRVGLRVADVTHAYPEKTVRIQFFRTRIEGDPIPHVHRRLAWVAPENLDAFPAPPPNAVVLDRILAGELDTH
ncbi:MAG: NUDIX domain-containing protein [Acidobacteria bacterium]|nr:NUDIX domain-containing protein [Acidobacteriota bacterium]